MEKLVFKPITEKLDNIEVLAQSSYTCLHDCERTYWSGNSKNQVGCTIKPYIDAYKSTNR